MIKMFYVRDGNRPEAYTTRSRRTFSHLNVTTSIVLNTRACYHIGALSRMFNVASFRTGFVFRVVPVISTLFVGRELQKGDE